MKTLIVYESNHSCSEHIVEKMKQDFGNNVDIVNLKKLSDPSVTGFQRIIIGSSLSNGKIERRVRSFCEKNRDELLHREFGLFICCRAKEKSAGGMHIDAYPEELLFAAKSTAVFTSVADYSRIRFLTNMIFRKKPGLKVGFEDLNYETVHQFSRSMDRIFNPFLFLC